MAQESILEEAARLTGGDRQGAYGPPQDHHGATAACATEYLRRRGILRPGRSLDAQDWACLLIVDKVIRHGYRRRRDNLVDVAGYAWCASQGADDGGEG